MKLRIGTRGSHLARTQATSVAGALAEHGHQVTIKIITTAGDRSTATSFGTIGPQGVFVREIEHALLGGDVDIAVHSYKDLPTRSPEGLIIGAVPARADPADSLVMTRDAASATGPALPISQGARVGTASARRQAWLRHLRPDLKIVPIRGNVPTRVNRLRHDLDGVLLAAAGLERLRQSPLDEVSDPVAEAFEVRRLAPEGFVPAPSQGALAIQCRRADIELRESLQALDHPPTRTAVQVERDLLARVEGGCDTAFGAYCTADDSEFKAVDVPSLPIEAPTESLPIEAPMESLPIEAPMELLPIEAPLEPLPNLFRLSAWLERDGRVCKAFARASNPDSLAESVWTVLETC